MHLEPWAEMEVPFYSWIRDDNFNPGRDIGGCPLRGSARSAQSSSGSEGWQVTITLGGAQTVVVNREAWLACAGAEHTLVVEIISDESYVDQLSECFGHSLYWQGKIQYEVPVIIK